MIRRLFPVPVPVFVLALALQVCACASAPPPCPKCPVAPPPVETACKPPTLDVDAVAKDLVAKWNAKDAKAANAMRSAHFRESVDLAAEAKWIDAMLDKGTLAAPKRIGGDGNTHGIYVLVADGGAKRLELRLGDDGSIVSLSAQPSNEAGEVAPPPPKPAETVARSNPTLGLPFKGEWLVVWGGPDEATNKAHLSVPSQRRAADVDKVDKEGRVKTGDGKRNADYVSWGADILAVADGTVILAVDGIPDNEPGERNTYFTSGNAVIVAHEGGIFSEVGHLKKGSVKVRAGAKVKRGDVLGKCGNSGNSSQPHLHFQLQDGPKMDASKGVEAVFAKVKVTRDGETNVQTGYTFLKDDRIAPP